MFGLSRTWLDGIAGGGLVLALLVVIALDHLSTPSAQMPRSASVLPVSILSDFSQRIGQPAKLRLAVTPTEYSYQESSGKDIPWDDMGKLLRQLGEGYRYDVIEPEDIASQPSKLDPYDVLFLTCASGGEELGGALRAFVARGGTLYASDFRYDAVAAAFPDVVDKKGRAAGTPQDVVAEVVDPALRDIIGPSITLRFDLSQWKIAAFAGPRVTPLLRGSYLKQRNAKDMKGVKATGTFLVKFTHGKGTVIFTSFHNEKQNSELEIKLLQHLVFQLVNASADAEVTETNERAGFEPTKSNLLSAPKDNPQVTKTYSHAKAGPLRFALAFRNEGARLGIDLHSPDGKSFHWEGTSTLMLEVPQAAAGEWRYTVTALHLPYENFPFSVTFGAKK
jgi:hypothetical protein